MRLTRRDFLAVAPLVASPAICCGVLPDSALGYFASRGRRLDLLDVKIEIETEPLEWGHYEVAIHLYHQKVGSVAPADLPFLSIPDGFPGPRTNDGRRLAPSLSFSIGKWPYGAPPKITPQTRFRWRFAYFHDGITTDTTIDGSQVQQCALEEGKALELRVSSTGAKDNINWALHFAGQLQEWNRQKDYLEKLKKQSEPRRPANPAVR